MPAITTYHTCKGSNACKAQGGCGFVQSVEGGELPRRQGREQLRHDDQVPDPLRPSRDALQRADRQHVQRPGGCAVPISASQIYPSSGEMALFDIGPSTESRPIGTMPFNRGEPVYDVAWRAYCEVLTARGEARPSAPPPADDLRVAFPPST